MKDIFKDKRGWIAFAIVVVSISIVGFTRLLNKNLNLTLAILFIISVVAVSVYEYGVNNKTEGLDD